MKITVLTLFPEIIRGFFESSIMARAVEKGLIEYELVDFRDFAADRHRTCDDYPYGGGPGMVLKAEPIARALDSLNLEGARKVFPSPSGRLFDQKMASEFAGEAHILLLCGRYEGVDQRIIDEYIDDEVSIGDYVISSGEVASLVIIDGVYRLLDGVISSDSLEEESFNGGILEYPQYTRPESFRNADVPEILLSGHHENIRKWRLRKGLEKTKRNRPDLLESENFNGEIQEILKDLALKDDDKEG